MRRITRTIAEEAPPRAKTYDLNDPSSPGLALRVTPSGCKTWSLRYRNRHGALRRLSLGRYPSVSPEEARREARLRVAAVARGEDPQEEKRSARTAERIEDLANWYLDEYVHTAGKAARSIATDRGYVRKHILLRPSFARRHVAGVDARDIQALKRELKATPGAFRKVRSILKIMFAHAEKVGIRPSGSNPTNDVTPYPERKIERFLSAEERARLEWALDEAARIGPKRAGHVSPGAVAAIRLLALTGMRKGEVVDTLRWGHVDWKARCIHLPTSKTGAKSIILSSQALDLLRSLYRDQPNTEPVIRGSTGGKVHNLGRTWLALRKRAGLDDVRLHDLRHSFASDAIMTGVPLAVVGTLLGHRNVSTTARYAHLSDQVLRDSANTIGHAIDRASRVTPEPASRSSHGAVDP